MIAIFFTPVNLNFTECCMDSVLYVWMIPVFYSSIPANICELQSFSFPSLVSWRPFFFLPVLLADEIFCYLVPKQPPFEDACVCRMEGNANGRWITAPSLWHDDPNGDVVLLSKWRFTQIRQENKSVPVCSIRSHSNLHGQDKMERFLGPRGSLIKACRRTPSSLLFEACY